MYVFSFFFSEIYCIIILTVWIVARIVTTLMTVLTWSKTKLSVRIKSSSLWFVKSVCLLGWNEALVRQKIIFLVIYIVKASSSCSYSSTVLEFETVLLHEIGFFLFNHNIIIIKFLIHLITIVFIIITITIIIIIIIHMTICIIIINWIFLLYMINTITIHIIIMIIYSVTVSLRDFFLYLMLLNFRYVKILSNITIKMVFHFIFRSSSQMCRYKGPLGTILQKFFYNNLIFLLCPWVFINIIIQNIYKSFSYLFTISIGI